MEPKITAFLPLSLIFTIPAFAAVDYRIDLRSPAHHLARVEAEFPEVKSGEFTVNLPVWRTGKYEVLPLADGIRQFVAKDSAGKPLPVRRSASGEWKVAVSQPTSVTISYQLYADELGQRTRHIDASHAYLDASSVFVYSPEFRAEPVTVSLNVPDGWQSHSGMDSGTQAHTFVAPNYDVLVDSPIETGISHHRRFSSAGQDYELVVWGEGNYDLDKMVTDLTKLATSAGAIWDDAPFKRYVYMVHATSGASGATEHLNSTVIQLPRFMFRERKDYLRFIGTASHEFVHTWNVKAYRPTGLVPYDYQAENLSELLWIAEGSTSYFQNQLLARAGVISAKELLDDIATRIDKHQKLPGREIQSVAEASLGQWVGQGGDYAHNHSVNIYSEGYMASLALDLAILKDSNLKHSYRDVHRALYRDFAIPKSYGVADVKAILQQLTGKDYSPWWQAHIESPLALDFDELLSRAGLKLNYGGDSKGGSEANGNKESERKQKVAPGFSLVNGSLKLATVDRGGNAWEAGLGAGNELVAINGLKLSADGFEKRLADFKPGDSIKVSFFADDKLSETTLVLGALPDGKAELKPLAKVSREQKAFFKAWLGIDWPFDDKGGYKKA
ncbi:M61 family peptidase [Shewanella sp. JM162201]|uniref:M61 family peptidase n=1 Tax=Shewanella jiangmenensis TaxID=2837387 RepID=A0ABS5UYN0_9GAMM|nr:M61 family peptidase [Shewanella jiangmenensis]